MRGCCRLQFDQVCLAGTRRDGLGVPWGDNKKARSSPGSVGMNRGIFRSRWAFVTFVALALSLPIMNAKNLEDLRWKERVLLIYAPEGSEKQLARQQELLRSHDAEMVEREVTQIVLRNGAESSKLVERFKLSGRGFTLLLIGKDGGEKLRSHEVVSPDRICRLIDSMPMRQEEMRKRTNRSGE